MVLFIVTKDDIKQYYSRFVGSKSVGKWGLSDECVNTLKKRKRVQEMDAP